MIPEFITDIKVTMKEGTEPLYNTMEFMSHENPHTQTRTNTHKTPEVPPSLALSNYQWTGKYILWIEQWHNIGTLTYTD